MAAKLKERHVHAPMAAGTCTTCHDPHGSGFAFQLPGEGRDACLTCHEDVAEAMGKKFAHTPAAKTCTVCHDPHGSKHPAQTREPLNQLCLACHHDAPASEPSADDPNAELLFGRTAPADERAMTKAGRRIELHQSLTTGHPSASHPVAGPADPADRGKPLTCASCHNPHGAESSKLFRFGALGVSGLCMGCHRF
jgi:predicted CXXCH cytochrome family protein